MKRPSRLILVIASLTVVGLLVGGTAYAMSSRRSDTFEACVNNRTGAIRMLLEDTRDGCYTRRGPWQETPISWSRNGGPAGPAGPAGPRGPRGPGGSGGNGDGDPLGSLDDLAGLSCNTDSDDEGVVEIRISPPNQGSGIQMICKTDGTVDSPPPPRTTTLPTPTPPPTRPTTSPTTTTRPPLFPTTTQSTPTTTHSTPTTTQPPAASQPPSTVPGDGTPPRGGSTGVA
ncbi:hypothetical protein GCM10010464_59030 [Pseudonocardia yunnanensis]